MKTTGELLEKSCEGHWEWRIPNFPMTREDADEAYFSRSFLFHDCSWNFAIAIVPNAEWIPFEINRQDYGPPRTVCCAFGIRKADGAEAIFLEETMRFYDDKPSLCVNHFLKKSDLLKRKSDLAPLGALTITCSLKSCESYSAETSLFTRLWNMRGCLEDIFNLGEKCDVVLKLKDEEIPVHTVILTKRSEVFARMLNTDVQESHTGVVEIKDADKITFKIVLSYLYNGEPDGLFSDNVCEVFKIAHQYELQELVKLCSEFMQGCLSVGMFCEVIVLAEEYKQMDLKESAENFFVKNASEIVKSGEWEAFKKKNPALVAELLECIVMDTN